MKIVTLIALALLLVPTLLLASDQNQTGVAGSQPAAVDSLVGYLFPQSIDICACGINAFLSSAPSGGVLLAQLSGVNIGDIVTYMGQPVKVRGEWHDCGLCYKITVSQLVPHAPCVDPNQDGLINISDAVFLVIYIFQSGLPPFPLSLGDANCDGMINISDVVYLLAYIFSGGPAPCYRC